MVKFKADKFGLVPDPDGLDPPVADVGGVIAPPYPILTEEMNYPPSGTPSNNDGSSRANGRNGRNGSLGGAVSKALQDVLGWKIKPGDTAGFVGALTQSFDLKTVEGAVVSTWTPRSYAVQSDLSGGLTGAQASIYTMAKTLVDQMLPLVDGLYPLDPAADIQDVAAVKDIVHSGLTNLVSEIGYLGGPRVMRVQHYFEMLMGVRLKVKDKNPLDGRRHASISISSQDIPEHSPLHPLEAVLGDKPWADPDRILGSFGNLRDLLGLFSTRPTGVEIDLAGKETIVPSRAQVYVNTVEDEQNVTNFRIITDYANSLLNAWSNSIRFFAFFGTEQSPFLGTQLVIISRQLGVIAEVVDEVRFVLDSVFLGPAQRETLRIEFAPIDLDGGEELHLPTIYLEDLLQWMRDFVGPEAQEVIQNAGKVGIGQDFNTMVRNLFAQAFGLYQYAQSRKNQPIGTARVQESLYKLVREIVVLYEMARSVGEHYIRAKPQ
jgi:hypothetical protein